MLYCTASLSMQPVTLELHKSSTESKLSCDRFAKYKEQNAGKNPKAPTFNRPDRYLDTPPRKSNLMPKYHTLFGS